MGSIRELREQAKIIRINIQENNHNLDPEIAQVRSTLKNLVEQKRQANDPLHEITNRLDEKIKLLVRAEKEQITLDLLNDSWACRGVNFDYKSIKRYVSAHNEHDLERLVLDHISLSAEMALIVEKLYISKLELFKALKRKNIKLRSDHIKGLGKDY